MQGVFGGNQSGGINEEYPSINHRFVTGIVKGADHNLWSIRGGDAASGSLSTFFAGQRPQGYYPMNKRGAILLGVGGDNSFRGVGTFYEGAMTAGYPTDETEDKVQENIVAAGYGITSSSTGPELEIGSTISFKTSLQESYLAHEDAEVMLLSSPSTLSAHKASTFTVREGNGDKSCYSFESVASPGKFLRQANYTMYIDSPDSKRESRAPLHWIRASDNSFEDDSTFCTEPGFTGSDDSTLVFRSWNFPTRYWRPHGKHGRLHIGQNGGVEPWDGTKHFHSEVTWKIVRGLV